MGPRPFRRSRGTGAVWYFLAWFALAMLAAAPAPDPALTPHYPEQPPPLAGPEPPPVATEGLKRVRYQLRPGWNVLSFPFAELVRVEGLKYALLQVTPEGNRPLDPVAHPDQVATQRGYWAYAQEPTQITTYGRVNLGDDPNSLLLDPGWNLVGCPCDQKVPLTQVGLEGADSVTSTLTVEEAVAPANRWLYPYVFQDNDLTFDSVEAEQVALTPYHAYWVFAYRPLQMDLNLGRPAPVVSNFERRGPEAVVTGRGLGSPQTARLIPAPGTVLSWTDTQIRFLPGPDFGQSAPALVVMNGDVPSNRMSLGVTGPGAAPTPAAGTAAPNTLAGQVLDDSLRPVSGAQVSLAGYPPVYTDIQGRFSFPGLTPGAYTVNVDAGSHGRAQGSTQLIAGPNRQLVLTLPARRGTLQVQAYSFQWGGKNYRPTRITVWEYGNYHLRYRKDFTVDWGWSGYNLSWGGIPVGKTYAIYTIWTDPQGNQQTQTRYRRLDSSSQTVYVYNNWTY